MRILVTGATGFVGHAVTSALADRGHVVVALGRNNNADVPAKADRYVQGDVRSSTDIMDIVADVDAVCHLAALVRVRDSHNNPLDYWRTNVGGTLNVLDALVRAAKRKATKRLILSSTGAVYGNPERQPIGEDEIPAPMNPYAVTKLAADLAASHAARTGAIGAVTLRAFNVAGASSGRTDHDFTRLIPKVLAVQAGGAHEFVLNGDGSAIRDFVHVEDMADAFVSAVDVCETGDWRVYNIGSGRRTTIHEVLSTVEKITGKPVPIHHAPPADEPPVLVADSSRAIAELKWQPKRSNLTRIVSDAWHAMTND